MQLIDEFATPAELTGYARAALADRPENAETLDRWLPNRTINDLSYRFTRGGGGLTEAAVFRAYDASSDVAVRPGGARVSGELPPISRKIPVGEYERIKRRNVDTQNAQIEARLELARGEALFSGAVNLNENGVQASVDFGRNAAHNVTASTPWSTFATADAYGDLSAWLDVYNATNGRLPAYTLMSRLAYNWLRRNTGLTKLANTQNPPTVLTRDALNTVLGDYDIPPVVIYDAQVSVNGTATRVTPVDKILFLPEFGDAVGQTLWGVPVEADDPRYGLGGDAAGVAVGGYKSEDPQTVWTRAVAIALPVVAAPDLTFQADVL
jgi:Tfp pilus assembly protein FimT